MHRLIKQKSYNQSHNVNKKTNSNNTMSFYQDPDENNTDSGNILILM